MKDITNISILKYHMDVHVFVMIKVMLKKSLNSEYKKIVVHV